MIRPRYALQLARTKLRSKRGILAASIVVSSILFAAVIGAIIVFTGVQKSAVRFVEAANNDHYLVAVRANIPNSVTGFYDGNTISLSLETVRAIRAYEKEYYVAERAKYKAAGVEYNEAAEVSALKPSLFVDEKIAKEQQVMINWASPVIEEMLENKFLEYVKTATNKNSDLRRIGDEYGATAYYKEAYSSLPTLPQLRLVQNNKEDFTQEQKHEAQTFTADKNTIYNGAYGFVDDDLYKRNMHTTDAASLKGIPVIPTAQEVAKLFGKELGIAEEPSSEADKAAWLKTVQEKTKGYTYRACFRNTTEQVLLDKINTDFIEAEAGKGRDDYVKPSLTYNLPETACSDITVASDTRTPAEKQFAEKLESDQKKLGTYVPPSHQLLTFQIVGVRYSQALIHSPSNVNDYVKGLLSGGNFMTPSNSTASIPVAMYAELPESMRFDKLVSEVGGRGVIATHEDFGHTIVAFNTIAEARKFVNEVGCPSSQSGDCNKLFYADTYGSNYLLLDEMGALFSRVMSIAFPALLALSLVIIWFTISRIMAENRKETAVYRAMGAKRGDIAGIYLTYTGLIALRIAIVSMIVGVAAAYAVHSFYTPVIEATATSMFGIIGNAPSFSMFDLSSPLLVVAVVSIFAISFVASIQPLWRNVLRPPVHDMRSE